MIFIETKNNIKHLISSNKKFSKGELNEIILKNFETF